VYPCTIEHTSVFGACCRATCQPKETRSVVYWCRQAARRHQSLHFDGQQGGRGEQRNWNTNRKAMRQQARTVACGRCLRWSLATIAASPRHHRLTRYVLAPGQQRGPDFAVPAAVPEGTEERRRARSWDHPDSEQVKVE
jgi:hypothetical protein